jgi:hypothetical protein
MTARKYGPICTYPSCGRSHNARGLCGPHGSMQRRGEDLRPIQNRTGPIQKPVSERFWSKVSTQANGCMEWQGSKTKGGYGVFAVDASHESTKDMAHRWAYENQVGTIPPGLDIDHLCRNRACVNPSHLEPVTRAENIRRAAAVKTECPSGHPYTEENTHRNSVGHRKCRTCTAERDAARRDEKNAKRRATRSALGPKVRVQNQAKRKAA